MLVRIDASLKHIGHIILLLFCSLLVCGTVFGGEWDVLAFREDFNAGVGESNMPDPNVWVCNNPCNWWWVHGRTFLPSPKYHPAGPFPRVENGVCAIEHHLYNPYDSEHWTFLGGELHTVRMFAPNTSYRFEAKVRCKTYPNGLVTSFFLYGYDCSNSNSDEVDFEFLSNKTNDDVNYPNGDPVQTNPWNESIQCPNYVSPDGLDLSKWNTFRIYWYPSLHQVDWTWVFDPVNDLELPLRTETNLVCIPDEPMAIYFNFWASNIGWQEAYDANLQPVSDPNANQIYEYEIEYVEARVPLPTCGDVNHPHPKPDMDYDCYVDWFDCDIFCGHWVKQNCGRTDCCGGADINGDCVVDLVDFSVLAAYWLECTDPNAPCNYNQ